MEVNPKTGSGPQTSWYQFFANFGPASLFIFKGADRENFFSNQELFLLQIVSFILMTSMCDSEVIS